jgi:hypothetical protein
MNIKFILPIALLTLVSLAFLVSAVQLNTSRSYGTMYLHEGWNLVYGFMFPEQLQQSSQQSNIVAIFGYNPVTNSYFQTYPNLEEDKTNPLESDEIGNLAFFVYSKKDMQIDYYALAEMEEIPYNQRQLYSGWNFFSFTGGEMFNKKLSEISGDCVIQKSYWFDPKEQSWTNFNDEIFRYEANLGTGFLLKVQNNCKLGIVGSSVSPPTLP